MLDGWLADAAEGISTHVFVGQTLSSAPDQPSTKHTTIPFTTIPFTTDNYPKTTITNTNNTTTTHTYTKTNTTTTVGSVVIR